MKRDTKTREELLPELQAFSQVGKRGLALVKLDMDVLIKDVWQELRNAYPERNMILSVDRLPFAQGDSSLVRQVCINLLENAVKYTGLRAAALIEVGAETRGKEVIFYIRDNGVGFDMAYRDKLFSVFQRLDDSDNFKGTGIGLAIVKRIIGKHGGRVWGEGEPGRGACFYFTLPAGEV